MARNYYTITTRAARQKLNQLVALHRELDLTHIAIGDGGGAEYDPQETQPGLIREKWRGPINSLTPDPSNKYQLIVEAAIPDEVGDFYVREACIIDRDGDAYAIASLPESYKPTLPSGSNKQMNIRLTLATANASSIRLVIDPNVTMATRQWTEDALATAIAPLALAFVNNASNDVALRESLETLRKSSVTHGNSVIWFRQRLDALEAAPNLDVVTARLASVILAQSKSLQDLRDQNKALSDALALVNRRLAYYFP